MQKLVLEFHAYYTNRNVRDYQVYAILQATTLLEDKYGPQICIENCARDAQVHQRSIVRLCTWTSHMNSIVTIDHI